VTALEVLVNSLTVLPSFANHVTADGTSVRRQELLSFLRSTEFKTIEGYITILKEGRERTGFDRISANSPFKPVLDEIRVNNMSKYFYKELEPKYWYPDSFLEDLEFFVKDLVNTPTEDWNMFEGNAYKLFIKAHLGSGPRSSFERQTLCIGMVKLIVTMGGFINKDLMTQDALLLTQDASPLTRDGSLRNWTEYHRNARSNFLALMVNVLRILDSDENGVTPISSRLRSNLNKILEGIIARMGDRYLCRTDFYGMDTSSYETSMDTSSDVDWNFPCNLNLNVKIGILY